jgi:hypothetical protein
VAAPAPVAAAPEAAGAPEAPAAPVVAGVQLIEPVPAAVRTASRADWTTPAAAVAGVGVLVLAGWAVTRKRGVRAGD